MNKSDLRLKYKELRRNLNIDQISCEIVSNIQKLDLYKNAENIMIYYPLKHEISLLTLLEDNKSFYLPKVDDNNLIACPYKSGDELSKSRLNIYEPKTSAQDTIILDIVFIPALSADTNYYRLGYGGGYYDRFISNNKWKQDKGTRLTKFIIVIPDELITDTLPAEPFDMPCDGIITQKKASI